MQAVLWKETVQREKRAYSKTYYQRHKDEILLRKALARAQQGGKLTRPTRERLFKANITSPIIRSY
jgi:hypothetical protein